MEREWEKTFDAVPDLIAILNKDFEIVRINRAMAARLGRNPRQCIGKKCHRLVHGLDEPPSYCPHASLIKAGGSHAVEVFEPNLDGTFIVTTSPLHDENGQITGSVHVARDISDRKRVEEELNRYRRQLEELVVARTADLLETNRRLQAEIAERRLAEERYRESERRYRIVADNTHDWEYWLDPGGAFVYSSPSCLRITGWPPEAFTADPGLFYRIIHPDDRDLMKRHWEEYQYDKKDRADEELEFRIIHRDGKVEWLGHVCQPVFDERNHFLGVRASNRSITERKEAQKEKSRLETQLRRAQKLEAIGTLAGGIAHDFNNILGAISGYTEMALSKLPVTEDTRVRRYLQHVYEGAGRAKELVRQILAFSRQGDRGVAPVAVTPIVKESIKLIRAILPATIKIRQKIKAPADIVLADPTHIHQVAMNLLTNAFHAMGEQGGRLEIELINEELSAPRQFLSGELPGGLYLVLAVKDSGLGISPAVRERIFDPFFSTKKPGVGTGLGLSVVHGIVKSCGGGIQLESMIGGGSEFRIYFPVSLQSKAESGEISKPSARGRAERLLFVDDDPVLVELGQEMLSELGYSVSAHTDSREALAGFRKTPEDYDLVITDQTMPELTGYELTREIRKIRPEIPVILCTGFSETVTPERTGALGIGEVILKPLLMEEMAEKIRRVLDRAGAGKR